MALTSPEPAHTAVHTQTQVQNNNNNIELNQPSAQGAMRPSAPPTATSLSREQDSQQEEVRMRGGEMCPGRFCFIVPCPLPCNCCII